MGRGPWGRGGTKARGVARAVAHSQLPAGPGSGRPPRPLLRNHRDQDREDLSVSRAVGLGADLAECCLRPRCPRPLRPRPASPLPTALSRGLLPCLPQGPSECRGSLASADADVGGSVLRGACRRAHGVQLAQWRGHREPPGLVVLGLRLEIPQRRAWGPAREPLLCVGIGSEVSVPLT